LGIRLQPELQGVGFKKKDVLHCSVPSKPPWLLKRPQIDFSVHDSCKESTPPEIFRAKYYEICDQYQDYGKLYTDGSMSGAQVGLAAICGTTTKTVRLHNGVGIFRAELYAITMALNIIYGKKENNFIIFTDSMSSLQAVKSFRLELDIVYQIIRDYSHLTESGKRMVVCWIPGHVNIPGNEKSDSAAKSPLTLPITKMKIPATEYIPRVSQFCLKEWQDIWNCCDSNKLHATYPNVGRILHYKNVPRRDAVVINRLRIGHTRLKPCKSTDQ